MSTRGTEKEEESTNGKGGRGGNSVGRGNGIHIRGRGKYEIIIYHCGVEGHKKSERLEGKIQ